MKKFAFAIALLVGYTYSIAQSIPKSSSELYQDLKRIKETSTVMYLAAHPDDENTRIISWLNHYQFVNTYYLSLTRGDGGQNLIGSETGPMLGLLRTQELLEARKIDGGNQWFTRANDFGYSKTATETLQIWNKDQILADVVYAIRLHQPDVIITRFDPDSNGKTHGHHTASAMLAMEAFDLAGDPDAYTEQLNSVSTWSPKRIFFNTSWWFYGSREAFEQADKSNLISIDVGTYYPELGESNTEIAAKSRSKHACQGFGSELVRGSTIEWLELLKGTMPSNNDILEGISSRYPKSIENQLDVLISNFDFQNPEKSSQQLMRIYQEIQQLKPSKWRNHKLNQIKETILHLNGFYAEWVTKDEFAIPGSTIETELEFTNRSSKPIRISIPKSLSTNERSFTLSSNESKSISSSYTISKQTPFDNAYWLTEPMKSIGEYTVSVPEYLGMPETPNTIHETFELTVDNKSIDLNIELSHKEVKASKGEQYNSFHVVPPVAVNLDQPVYLYYNSNPQSITATITSFSKEVSGTVELVTDKRWKSSPAQQFTLKNPGDVQKISFEVSPPKDELFSTISAIIESNGIKYSNAVETIEYDHIDKQIVFRPNSSKIGKLALTIPNVSVGYINGSGDQVGQSLRQLGLSVTELDPQHLSSSQLTSIDVIVVGIRAFDVLEQAEKVNHVLTTFAKQGGTVIVQYQNPRNLKTKTIAPLNLELGRARVSQEDAELILLEKNHPVFHSPNKITTSDFDGWVQERGLYFASSWAPEFTPLIESHDEGEDAQQGILLIANYGQGHYVYTGLSFFRQLPAGNAGAYRLFMNLLALD